MKENQKITIVHDHNLPPDKIFVEDLTWREQEVLTLLVKRLTNREIGDRLHLAETTVKSHVGRIISKLGVKNRRQAVERAKELGLLDQDRKAEFKSTQTLPADSTPFIGRAEDLAEICRLLDETRLLSLTGTGGIGKTRLALRSASDLRDEFENGVFFVPLAPISSAKHIVQAIAEAMGFPLSTEAAPIEQLLSHLRRRQLLLVMDNFEHLPDGVDIVAEILQRAPNVKILVTSRENLKLHGETVLSITGMDFPSQETSAEVQAHDAIELFLHSIRRIQPEFDPNVDDMRQLTDICKLVEGMPLAIELAAGWMSVLSPNELVNEIQRGLDILTSEMRDVPERHHSIRAVFDQSWSLLNQTERETLMRLSVFRGGFTRKAGQEVTGASLQLLAGLINKSFLRHDPISRRFEIHELLRQYAQERLEETPENGISAMEAHAAYFANFMAQRWEHLRDHRQKVALTEINADLENIRTAWRYRVEQANAPQILKFVNSFWLVYWFRGWNHGGEELFREAVTSLSSGRTDEATEFVKALAQAHQGFFKTWLGFAGRGYNLAQESVDILEQMDRPFELALALGSLNLAADFLTRYDEGEKVARKMLDIATRLNDKWLLAFSLYKLSVANPPKRDYAEMRSVAQSSLNLYEELGEGMVSILTLVTLGHAAFALGEHAQAREIYLQCLRTSEAVGYRWGTANACKYLGQMALSLNETIEAETYLLRSLKIADEIGSGRDQVNLLCDLARVRMAENQLEGAVELLGVVLQHPTSRLHRLGGGSVRDRAQELLHKLKIELSTDAYDAALERGNGLEFDQVIVDQLANL
ncbi:MAG: LuxR C-terminal-related transcriptional regulator [Anaerolineales bacterium]